MGIVDLCREFETGQCLIQMGLQRADHNKHEGLRVASKRVLQQVCQLSKS
jgi:hypothetical protein